MISSRVLAQPTAFDDQFNSLPALPPGVVKLRYTFEDDWSGDPAIFFWVTLSDDAARKEVLPRTSRRVKDFITQQLEPMAQWALIPYFNFRSQSEQAKLKEAVFG